jgi:hypothetical protein
MLPVRTVAMAVKRICKYCGMVCRYDSNFVPLFLYICGLILISEYEFKVLATIYRNIDKESDHIPMDRAKTSLNVPPGTRNPTADSVKKTDYIF